MGWIDAELALTALAAMLSPTTLTFSVLVLVLGDRPFRTGLWFYLGALTATLGIGVVAAFVLTAATSYFDPAYGGLLPELVDRRNVQQANGLVRATADALSVGGWALAGLVQVDMESRVRHIRAGRRGSRASAHLAAVLREPDAARIAPGVRNVKNDIDISRRFEMGAMQ